MYAPNKTFPGSALAGRQQSRKSRLHLSPSLLPSISFTSIFSISRTCCPRKIASPLDSERRAHPILLPVAEHECEKYVREKGGASEVSGVSSQLDVTGARSDRALRNMRVWFEKDRKTPLGGESRKTK